jgi:hypothetical protein
MIKNALEALSLDIIARLEEKQSRVTSIFNYP